MSAFPHLWLPSKQIVTPLSWLDRMRRSIPMAMLSKGKRAANGKLCRDPTTKKGQTTTCCVTPGTSCAQCTGDTPAQWDATFTSVTLCTSCVDDSGGFNNSAKITTGTTFSGTYRLSQLGGFPCFWLFTENPASIIASYYGSLSCAGIPTLTDQMDIGLAIGATTVSVIATLNIGGAPTGEPIIIFSALFTKTTCQATYSSKANDITACGFNAPTGEFYLGHGGNVTLAPV